MAMKSKNIILYLIVINFIFLFKITVSFSQNTSNRLIISEGYLIQKRTYSYKVKDSNLESEKFESFDYFFVKDSLLMNCFIQDILINDVCEDSSLKALIFNEKISEDFDLYNKLNNSVLAVSNFFLDYSGIKGAFENGKFEENGNLFCSYSKQKELQNVFDCKLNQTNNKIESLKLITKSSDIYHTLTEVKAIKGTYIFVYGNKLIPDSCIKNSFVFISTLF